MEDDQFNDVRAVISDPLKFKSKLGIGEDAYGTLRLKNKVADFWDVLGGLGTGAAVAQTSVVASTFFAPGGLVGLLGLGTAVTPVGWVVAAAVLSGGAVVGVRRFARNATGSRVDVIPKFVNTPIDVLAVSIFDLVAPLALKVAAVDGEITDDERKWIKCYFEYEWGYDASFLDAGLRLIESTLDEVSIREIAETLAEFSKASQDCNYSAMTRDLMVFLNGVMEADGAIDEREEFAIERIEVIFAEAGRTFSVKNVSKVGGEVLDSLKKGANSVGKGVGTFGKAVKDKSETFVQSETFARTAGTVESARVKTMESASDSVKAGKELLGKFFKKSGNS